MRHLPPGRRMSVVRVTRLLLGSIAACAAAATAATPSRHCRRQQNPHAQAPDQDPEREGQDDRQGNRNLLALRPYSESEIDQDVGAFVFALSVPHFTGGRPPPMRLRRRGVLGPPTRNPKRMMVACRVGVSAGRIGLKREGRGACPEGTKGFRRARTGPADRIALAIGTFAAASFVALYGGGLRRVATPLSLTEQGPKLSGAGEIGRGAFGYSVAVSGDGSTGMSAPPRTRTARERRGCSSAGRRLGSAGREADRRRRGGTRLLRHQRGALGRR